MRRQVKVVVPTLLVALFAGCGGGGGGSSGVPGQPPQEGVPPPPPPLPPPSIPLVMSVPPAVYSGAYADEKVAVFNRLNADRSRCGFGMQAQNSLLDKAAQAHADYLKPLDNLTHYESNANLPAFTGYDPVARWTKQGYGISYGSEIIGGAVFGPWYRDSGLGPPDEISALHALRRLYASVYHLKGAMERTLEVGVGVTVQAMGPTAFSKSLVVDSAIRSTKGQDGQQMSADALATFPCDGTAGVYPAFMTENPDPFPAGNREVNPYGQPVFISGPFDATVKLIEGSMTVSSGEVVPTVILDGSNDPNGRVLKSEAYLVPTKRLDDNATYNVVLRGTHSGLVSASNPTGAFTRSFSFRTGTLISE